MMAITPTDNDKPYRGRRMSWREFYQLRPDLRPDNDNGPQPADSARQPQLSMFPVPASRRRAPRAAWRPTAGMTDR